MEIETFGNLKLICADAAEIVANPDIEFDVLVADPPYGVAGSSGTINKKNNKANYKASFPDTPEYIDDVCAPIIRAALAKALRGAITPGGKCAKFYPFPDAIGGYYQPAGSGMCEWGAVNLHPIFYYGKDPRLGKAIIPLARQLNEAAEKNGHPCPKPLKVWSWLVHKVSLKDDVVFDPFLGSGTTAVACHMLQRKFIGVELEPRYFDIACRRVSEAVLQGNFLHDEFVSKKSKNKMEKLI